MDEDTKRKIQSKRLVETVAHIYQNVPSYREKMQAIGLEPEDIRSIEDLSKLPFTYKTDLRDNYPYGLFATDMSNIVRVHASSGTTGKPTVVGYTRRDIVTWSEIMARCLAMAGADRTSIIQVSYGYGLFTGGLGAHYGAERLGASVIPMSGGNTKKQVMLLRDFGATHICCTPSYALVLAETMREMGIAKEELKLKAGVFGAEPWTEGMRNEIQEALGIKAMDIYGLSEIMGPGVACECEERNGMHIHEDYFIPEIINPDTGEVLPPGEKGELVITTIRKEGLPLIRYRTKDITSLMTEKCSCGRTLVKMNRVMGRSDDMLIIRGVNVFPSQIESVLVQFPELSPNYQIIVGRENNVDTFEVKVELNEGIPFDEIRMLENLRATITKELLSLLGIRVKLTLMGPKSIERSEGKAKRVIDTRNLV